MSWRERESENSCLSQHFDICKIENEKNIQRIKIENKHEQDLEIFDKERTKRVQI